MSENNNEVISEEMKFEAQADEESYTSVTDIFSSIRARARARAQAGNNKPQKCEPLSGNDLLSEIRRRKYSDDGIVAHSEESWRKLQEIKKKLQEY
jgi:hypothetical protein